MLGLISLTAARAAPARFQRPSLDITNDTIAPGFSDTLKSDRAFMGSRCVQVSIMICIRPLIALRSPITSNDQHRVQRPRGLTTRFPGLD